VNTDGSKVQQGSNLFRLQMEGRRLRRME